MVTSEQRRILPSIPPISPSPFNPRTNRRKNNFATLCFVLPSQFEGGITRLSYHPDLHIANHSTSSATQTSVLAWYSNVTHETDAITSGYRLVLDYDLIHVTKSPPPMFPVPYTAWDRFCPILTAWKKKQGANPILLIYAMFEHYTTEQIHDENLFGDDEVKLNILRWLANDLGFCINLTFAEYELCGDAVDFVENRKWEDIDWLEFRGRPSERITIWGLVDLEGEVLADKVVLDSRICQTIPTNIRDMINNDPSEPDEEIFYLLVKYVSRMDTFCCEIG